VSADRLRIAGRRYRQRRELAEAGRQAMNDEIRAAAETMSESEIARIAGVTRMTVRKSLGK
jgi:DNA invertase Pin-like site-specific DNA recombinase